MFVARTSALKCGDPLLAGARREQLEQQRPEAPPLPGVDDGDGRLGHAGPPREAHEAGDADALARLRVQGDQGLVVAVVDLGQVVEHLVAQLRHGDEEALVARLGTEPLEPGAEQVAVLRLDRPDDDRGPVAQRVAGPRRGLGGHA